MDAKKSFTSCFHSDNRFLTPHFPYLYRLLQSTCCQIQLIYQNTPDFPSHSLGLRTSSRTSTNTHTHTPGSLKSFFSPATQQGSHRTRPCEEKDTEDLVSPDSFLSSLISHPTLSVPYSTSPIKPLKMCTSTLHLYACSHTEHELHRYCSSNPSHFDACPKYAVPPSSSAALRPSSSAKQMRLQKQMAKDGYKLPSESFSDCQSCGLREIGELPEGGWVGEWKQGVKMENECEEVKGEEEMCDDVGVGDGNGVGSRAADESRSWARKWLGHWL